ncbi:conserved hypothetical protein [Arthrobacter sp. 9V]|uniref:HamA C-terminal domain-containing protein n=1 Tax=Arthrobacter sp. 9V TaxID=2653132 RepID=UPI0012EEECAC|nr:DUF1837 domain-containing protein [Arthrobacter sp. 9V]VXB56765.1 conserved hypothetical protein [Arthrobacter sp. 9V]
MSLPLLPLTILKPERFFDLFYKSVDFEIQKKTSLHLHVLRIEDGEFALGPLYTQLLNHSDTYVLSRTKYAELVSDISRYPEMRKKIQAQFKTPDENAGEGGELLLYAFLEGHLGAPKVLSKMELKTSPELYVNGADGVHLLEVDASNYQLIFGESKMYGDTKSKPGSSIKNAIESAFKSMAETKRNLFQWDTWLVESQIMQEIADQEKISKLAEILLPSARAADAVKKSNAFGVFLGYEIDALDIAFEDYLDEEIESHLRQMAQDAITKQVETIADQISKFGLGGHHFYIYAIPFLKRRTVDGVQGVQEVRMRIAEELSGRTPSVKTMNRLAEKAKQNGK